MRRSLLALSLVWGASLAAKRPPEPQALLLCYRSDAVIDRACQALVKKLSECTNGKFLVRVIDDAAPDTVDALLTKKETEPFPSNLPVFVVGHGGTDDKGEHYVALRKFWGQEGPVTSEQYHDPKNTFRSPALTKVLEKHLVSPAIWYMSCHSGGTCRYGKNVGASCKSWESTPLTDVRTGPLRFNIPVDAMTSRILRLLCDADAFKEADTSFDRRLDEGELRAQLQDSYMDSSTCVTAPVKDAKEQKQFIKMISAQLGEQGTITGHKLVEEGGKTKLQVDICQADCMGAAFQSSRTFSPVLKKFSVPSPELQQLPEPELIPHVTRSAAPAAPSHSGRPGLGARIRERLQRRR